MSQPEQIRAYRQRYLLSQRQLAQGLGVHAITICNWERGVYVPPVFLFLALDELARRLNRKRKQEQKRKEREAARS